MLRTITDGESGDHEPEPGTWDRTRSRESHPEPGTRHEEPTSLEIEPLDLLQHVIDARADQIALFAQREDFAARRLGVGEPRP